jgi:dipeptidyl-peptidase 4
MSLPRQYARTRRMSLGVPGHITLRPDGGTAYFLRTRAGEDPVSCLWALDCATGAERLLADPVRLLAGVAEELPPEEKARRERARERSAGIVAYTADDAGELLAFALSGQLWTIRPADGAIRRLAAAEPVVDPRPDPTGRRIAYVCRGAVRVIEADGSADRVVAGSDAAVAPGAPDVSFGLAEHVAAEEMGRETGYWWAPDGERLLVARVDATQVQRWYITDPADPASPPASFRYPAAGTANAAVSLWIAAVTAVTGRPLTRVSWDATAFEYLTRAGWDAFGPYAAVQSRSQRHVQVLGIDAEMGAAQLLAEQRDEFWVTLVNGLPVRTAAGILLTSGDLDDTRRLLADGEPVTPPGLQLEAVLAVDGEAVLFTASDEPTEVHLWAWEPVSGTRRLSDEPGLHSGTRRGGTTVLISSTRDRPGTRTTVRMDGADGAAGAEPAKPALVQIASRAQRPVLDLRREMLSLGPDELRAALFLPSWWRPADGPLPVLMDPYGGPAMRKATADQSPETFVSQWFAEQGLAVLVADGAGTPGRGPAWERAIYLDIAGPALRDQVTALHEAARRQPALDLSRVAIRGWSYGGFLAALAVLRRPDVFHAAIAGAPVTDQRLYDTHWRERHLGHPDEHPEVYDRCSLIGDAAALSRPLLLVHGLADDNVVAAHTLRLSAALLAVGRPHEVLPLPRATHQAAGAVGENLLLHQLDFLQRTIGLRHAPSAR